MLRSLVLLPLVYALPSPRRADYFDDQDEIPKEAEDSYLTAENSGWASPTGWIPKPTSDIGWTPLPSSTSLATTAAGLDSGIQWLTPTSGTSLVPGAVLSATWKSSAPLWNPGFSLCTAANSCGEPTFPGVVNNGDGSSSATLSLPDMDDMDGLYLRLSAGDRTTSSPAFNVGAVVLQSPGPSTEPLPSAAVSSAPPVVNSIRSTGITRSQPPLSNTGLVRATSPLPTTPAPPNPTVQPPLATSPVPDSQSVLVTASTLSLSENLGKPSVRPTAAAIAVPLALCALVLLSALVFCARSRAFRKPAVTGRPDDGWEQRVREKAAEAAGTGVVVTRRSEIEKPSENSASTFTKPPMLERHRTQLPSLPSSIRQQERVMDNRLSHRVDSTDTRFSGSGSGTRCLTPTDERFTTLPERRNYYSTSRGSRRLLCECRECRADGRYECMRTMSKDTFHSPHSLRRWPKTPLPKPMIRTTSRQSDLSRWEMYTGYEWRPKVMPHRTGVLERGPSSASTVMHPGGGWHEARDYSCRGEGQEYASLQRAIGSPEK